jgi:hypothetical protein
VISGLGLSLFISPLLYFDHEPWATLINFRTSLNEFRQSCAIKPRHGDTLFPVLAGASDSAVANREKLTIRNIPKFLYRVARSRFPDFVLENRFRGHIRRNSGGENLTRIFREETFQPCQYMFIHISEHHLI